MLEAGLGPANAQRDTLRGTTSSASLANISRGRESSPPLSADGALTGLDAGAPLQVLPALECQQKSL